jgi:hypothetical protein
VREVKPRDPGGETSGKVWRVRGWRKILEHPIPVLAGGTKALDGRMAGDHGGGHGFAGGHTAIVRVEGVTTEGIDGGFTQDDGLEVGGRDGEEVGLRSLSRR